MKGSIIEALKNGDSQTLKKIYLENKEPFMNFAKKYNLSNETLVDIYQDAIVALRENAMQGNLDTLKSEISTYLFGIGKYMIYNYYKKSNKERLTADISSHFNTNDLTEKEFIFEPIQLSIEQRLLKERFSDLGDKCKEILTLFYYRGFSLDEILEHLDYSSKNVLKSQKSRCLKTLKDLINNA